MGFPAWRADGASAPIPRASLGEDERILHALNRLGFGPRPGDLERVRGMGLATYVEQQLHPEMIDDSRVEQLLEDSRTLYMTPAELLTEYPPPALLRGISSQLTTRMGMDPDAVGELFPEIRRKDKDQGKGKGKKHRTGKKVPLRKDADDDGRRERMMNGPDHIVVELGHAKLIRAVHGEQQLQEVMTDFWFNHFNVFIGKGATRWWTTGYEYEAIRPHALGKFRDLLGAVARHPAMLFYLDNWLSTAEGTRYNQRTLSPYVSKAIKKQDLPPGGVATLVLRDRGVKTRKIERQIARRESQQRKAMQGQSKARKKNKRGKPEKAQPGGLNENYARELLELHTLGVDGGYTQQDIIEVARCFTGWTVLPVQAAQQFVFVEEFHDNDKKVVLGQRVKGKGVRQGEAVLDRLARHPATARFVSTKLAAASSVTNLPQRWSTPWPRPSSPATATSARSCARCSVPRSSGHRRSCAPRSRRPSSSWSAPPGRRMPRSTGAGRRRCCGSCATWANRCTVLSLPPATRTPPRPGCPRARCSVA